VRERRHLSHDHDKEKPDRGEMSSFDGAARVVDQTRESLPNDKTAWRRFRGAGHPDVGKFEMPRARTSGASTSRVRSAEERRCLSGGERGGSISLPRCSRRNVLLLDEPSNDLDVETLRGSRRAHRVRRQRAGRVTRRWFLDRIATHILSRKTTRNGVLRGNYQDYEADKKKRLGETGTSASASLQAADALTRQSSAPFKRLKHSAA